MSFAHSTDNPSETCREHVTWTSTSEFRIIDCDDDTNRFHHHVWFLLRTCLVTQTIQTLHQEGPKRQANRQRSCWQDSHGKDTFDLSDWWKSNCATLPGFAYVLRAVLTNAPNSCPPERLFSIFNATYNDDQKQSQFNKLSYRCSRSLTNETCSIRVSSLR